MKKMRSFIIFFVIVILCLVSYDQSRSFYELSKGNYITVWKRLGGQCYIVFGKYYGVGKPSDYVRTTNSNAVTVIMDSSPEFDYVISNDYGESLSINTSHKIDYYDYKERDTFLSTYYANGKILSNYDYLQIDIKEKLVVVNGTIR